MKTTTTLKKSFIKSLFITSVILILSVSTSGNAYAQQKKEKLLGEKTFDIELTIEGKSKKEEPAKDQLMFRAERLNSSYMMQQYTFTGSAYTATVDSTSGTAVITFVSDSKNADGDLLKWNGTVTKEAIEGTAVLTDKKGKVKKEYSFKGQQKKFRGK